jgi:predicted transcriptional regulator
MITNYERVIKKFIPAFRLKAAKVMVDEYSLKQQQAALMLGTTQAAISKYLKENPNKYKNVNIDKKSLREFVERIAKNDEKSAQKIMCTMCQDNKKFDCNFIVK